MVSRLCRSLLTFTSKCPLSSRTDRRTNARISTSASVKILFIMQFLIHFRNGGHSFVPQLPQNFVPGGFCVPQDEHSPGVEVGACAKLQPQLLQKRTVLAFFAPQLGQDFSSMLAPQLLQNFPLPAGFPQAGQTVVLLSSSPAQTVAVCPASSMLRRIASAFAFAT